MRSLKAFCLSEPSVLFMSLAIFETGVLAFECCFSSLMSAFVYGLGGGFFFFTLAKLFLLEVDWLRPFGRVAQRWRPESN